MKKIILLAFAFVGMIGAIFSVTVTDPCTVIDLWISSDAPVSNDINDKAQLFIYKSQEKNAAKSPAVLIFPGGGYATLSIENEGHALAQWFSQQGFTAIVLKYRLPNQMKEIPFDDAKEAFSIITQEADRLNIDVEKIGIAGSSAGGHLAAIFSNYLVNQPDSVKPAFNILFYPVISFEQVTKGGTRNNLLGMNPSAEEIMNFSAQLQVNPRTPPTIILVSDDDESVPSTHSTIYYDALKEHQIPASLYIFPTGGHGWAMKNDFEYNNEALRLLSQWLEPFR